MMAYLVGGRVSVGSEVHTTDSSFSCTTCSTKPIFVYLEACCLLLFAKAENFVKYTFIYIIIQLYFSTLLHLILPLYFSGFACKLKS